MRNRKLPFVICALFLCLIPQVSQSCTTFCLDNGNQLVVGRNYDFSVGDCLVFVNKRDVSKIALSLTQKNNILAQWTSTYGSVTFNPWGREFPSSGMNEAGLVVSAMGLRQTNYPVPDVRHEITHWQWIQYQLDNFSLVKEVVRSDSQIRIPPFKDLGFHYFVIDRKANCAVIEFLDGEMVHYFNEDIPAKVLTNNTYEDLIKFWTKGTVSSQKTYRSLERFVQASDMVEEYDPKNLKSAIDHAFDILKAVELGEIEEVDGVRIATGPIATEWSIVYDIKNLHVYFRTLSNPSIRHFSFHIFDFSCSSPVKVLDIHNNLSGDISNKFMDYTYKINNNLLKTFFKKVPLLSNKEIDIFSHYPESTVCIDK